jgi:hypothetical protein
MHLKTRNKTISLAFLGDGWQDGTLTFRALRLADLTALTADETGSGVLTLLKDTFVSGSAPDSDGQIADVAADDLDQFDLEAVTEISRQLSGVVDPKASPTSTATSTPEASPQPAISN